MRRQMTCPMNAGGRYDPRLLKSPSNFISVSNEEDDVISHHDLVVILHAGQSATHLGLCKRILTLLVDVVHQRAHLHRLSVSRLEHSEQRRLELLQPGGGKTGKKP